MLEAARWRVAVAKKSSELEALASTVQRLGVLLSAGVAPASGWNYLATDAKTPGLATISQTLESGGTVTDAVLGAAAQSPPREADAWRALAAAWHVATETGAPLAATLGALAGSLRDLAQNQRELATALAAPVATARMVLALPFVGILFAMALGFDSLGVLLTTAPGFVCLVLGSALIVGARLWSRWLVSRARPADLTPGLVMDLVAIAVSSGASIPRALATVDTAAKRCGLTINTANETVDEVLTLSRRAGVPAATLLRSESEEARRAARSESERRAATLSVTLMLPLGLCILPAFMLLGVAPLLISIVASTVAQF